jgi:hypothetical protein
MIETIMYFCIGFLSASLIAISLMPLIHGRAVRLTRRRIENAMPQSMAEISADKDLQRAEFAVSTRRLEMAMEKLRDSNAGQLADIGRKDNIINRLKLDRQTHQVEMLLLKGEVGSLKEQLRATAGSLEIQQSRSDETDKGCGTSKEALESDAVSVLASPVLKAEHFSVGPDVTKGSALNQEREHSDASLVPLKPAIMSDSDPMVRIPVPGSAPECETGSISHRNSSIHVSPADHFAVDRTRRRMRLPAAGSLILLVGVCGFAWNYYGSTNPAIVSWVKAITAITLPTTTKGSPPPEEKAVASVLARQPENAASEATAAPNKDEPSAATQVESSNHSAAPNRNEHPKETSFSLPPEPQPKLVPVPETPPTTIPGWIVREVADGRAVVQGPNGIWRVGRGDVLPGAGRVDSIVRWGHRWIVATNRGLISTP